jgi:hypothetical protein
LDLSTTNIPSKVEQEKLIVLEYRLDIIIEHLTQRLQHEQQKLGLLESFLVPLKKESRNVRERQSMLTVNLQSRFPTSLVVKHLSDFNPTPLV